MNLIIDIGNTHTKAAGFDKGRMIDHLRLESTDHEELMRWMGEYAFNKAIYSEVGKMEPELSRSVSRCCATVIRLDHLTPLPFQVLYRTTESLGYDRIAAVAGAFEMFPGRNIVVFDFGTAITIDFLTSEGEYLGGNISPGMNIRFKSLHDYTASLPLLEKDTGFPFFGDDTRSAIKAGVQRGIIHEITGYIRDFMERHASCNFIVTGGDAAFFAPFLPYPVTVDPLLVLKGLNAILEYNSNRLSTE